MISTLGPASAVFILGHTGEKQFPSLGVCGVYAVSLAPSCGGLLRGRTGLLPAVAEQKGNLLAKVVEPAVGLGLIFHFVSLVEYTVLIGHLSWASIHYSESILAFVAMVVFFIFFVGYRTISPGIVIFPHRLRADLCLRHRAEARSPFTSPLLRSSWIFVHVVLIFTGYAGLFLSFGASLLYLMQERALKSKSADRAADEAAAAADHRRDLVTTRCCSASRS